MKQTGRLWALAILALAASSIAACKTRATAPLDYSGPVADWPCYGGEPGGERYSPLTQITPHNVAQLKVAWIFHTGDVSNGAHTRRKTAFETTPIVAGGTLYLSTPFGRVIALDPATGREKWAYDSHVDRQLPYADALVTRGVSTWLDPDRLKGEPCHRRIFLATIDARLIALDAATGGVCTGFGSGGQIDLKAGVGDPRPGEYEVTSPPAIIDSMVVVGSGISDNQRVDAPRGVVRAFDARTGALKWSWDPVPRNPADPAFKTWAGESALRVGAGNVWSIISVDPARHLVFLPTTSPSPDFYGGERLGNDVYADSVVALDSRTGKVAWYFQTVHHDLWDYDNPAEPLLGEVRMGGKTIAAVIQGNKDGFIYVLNRETGAPLFPVVEKPVPQSDVPGEQSAATQPYPSAPPPVVPQSMKPEDAFGLTFWDRGWCRREIAGLRNQGVFTPPSIGGSLEYPGYAGGMEWSGGGFDPVRQIMVVNTNNLAAEVHLIPRDRLEAEAKAAYRAHPDIEFAPQAGTPYGMSRSILISPLRVPCTPPPWGRLTAIDIPGGRIMWSVPLGDVVPHWLPDPGWGAPNLGGAIVTASGLVFIGATFDPYFHAFDVRTGKLLWESTLPAAAQATPITYRLGPKGKQYVVIAAGGHGKMGDKLGDSLVAFSLP